MMHAHPPVPAARQSRAAQVNDLLPLGDWLRHHSLRSWPVQLFLLLICVPSVALVILGGSPSARTFDEVAWIFAVYFAIAWLLLLGVIVRPAHVTRLMLVVVIGIALVTQVPLSIALEVALHSSFTALGPSIYSIGLPEEIAKAIPVLAVALVYRGRRGLTPRDYLFLGAVSGLVFGASEVVHYFTVNGVAQFYATVQGVIPAIVQLINSGRPAPAALFAVLIGPVRYFVLDFVWRFVTDPITHACWAGLTGYFIGLAVTRRHRWYLVAWAGLAIASILHGLNDWSQVNGHWPWIAVTVASGILFLGYAKAGTRSDMQVPDGLPPAFRLHQAAAGAPTGSPDGPANGLLGRRPTGPYPEPAAPAAPRHAVPDVLPVTRQRRPWWEH